MFVKFSNVQHIDTKNSLQSGLRLGEVYQAREKLYINNISYYRIVGFGSLTFATIQFTKMNYASPSQIPSYLRKVLARTERQSVSLNQR